MFFDSCRHQNRNFLLVSQFCRLSRTPVTLVSFVPHFRRSYHTGVALVHTCVARFPLVSLVSGFRAVK